MPNQASTVDPSWDRFVNLYVEFLEMLSHESERGSVIIAAAIMDEGLEQLLKAKLIPSSEKNDELFNGAYAPLENFSAKIDLAYRMKLITLKRRSSLHLIRKLRNDFAHSHIYIHFESHKMHSRVHELFKLNESLLNMFWDLVKKKYNHSITEIAGDYVSKHGFDYLVKVMGLKSTFEILSSLIAASLYAFYEENEPLIGKDEGNFSS
ncbi:MAG: hypothetical protein ABIJ52_13055 [Pseudomonadota bacterium]|nr:hypothetical protein [Pseudomonadota bacterium]